MKKGWKRLFSLLLAIALCVGMLPFSASAAGDAMSLTEVKKLLNSVKLLPQKTGYPTIDQRLEEILAPYKDKDTYTKLKGMYDWSVNQIKYSWNGYSQDYAPAYDKFTLKYDLEYETGLPEAYPKDMIYRAYHMLTAKTGVCYDWGILFAVMARYVGVESYVHTGILRIGDWTGHHGWTELRIGGKNYIFDAQQDWRSKGIYGYIVYDHFGIAPSSAWRYTQETSANKARDASLLPMTAERVRTVTLKVHSSKSGQAKGGGKYHWGETVTLASASALPVSKWYGADGTLLSVEPLYPLKLEQDAEVYALFQGDQFADVAANAWYLDAACEAGERGMISGTSPGFFRANQNMTRAMLVSILANVEKADLSAAPVSPFEDLNQESWYAGAVDWAYAAGITGGASETEFEPYAIVTREQAVTMMIRYLESRGITAIPASTSFVDEDQVSAYAREPVAQAYSLGLLAGYKDGTVRPRAQITRGEGVALLINMVHCMEAA